MPAKKDLAGLLGGAAGAPLPEIRRGQGMRLSTEQEQSQGQADRTSAETHDRTNAQSHKNAAAPAPRINRGYALREDLVKQLKRVALDEDRKLYEVMDDAMEQYLARRRAAAGDAPA